MRYLCVSYHHPFSPVLSKGEHKISSVCNDLRAFWAHEGETDTAQVIMAQLDDCGGSRAMSMLLQHGCIRALRTVTIIIVIIIIIIIIIVTSVDSEEHNKTVKMTELLINIFQYVTVLQGHSTFSATLILHVYAPSPDRHLKAT